MGDPLGNTNVQIGFIADPAPAVAAAQAVSDSLDTITASGAGAIASLSDFSDACDLAAASSADTSAASMDASASLDALSASADAGTMSFAELTASVDDTATSMVTLGAATDDAAASTAGAGAAIDFTNMSMTSMLGGMGQLIVTAGLFVAAMAAWNILQDVSGWIQNVIQQMFQLDEQTQKTVNSWQFLFAEQGVKGSGLRNAQNLAGWAYNESPKLPFTAMDLRGAISELGTASGSSSSTGLGAYLGMSPAQIEEFMPVLADIASTLGASANQGQGTTLMQAANAYRMALMGRTMELKTQLNLPPQLLMQYGLKGKMNSQGMVHITDPASLMTAMINLARARGLIGAAGEQETNTFWGAYSSFQDYLQNALQTMGGINPATGAVTPGSMFGDLQNLLINANTMLAQGQIGGTSSPIAQLVGVGGNILGGLTGGGGSFLGGFLGGMSGQGTSVIGDLFDKIKEFGAWLSSSDVQAKIHELGKNFGEFMGQALKLAQGAMPDLIHAFQDLAKAAGAWWNSFTPAQQASLKNFLALIIESGAGIVEFIAHIIDGVAAMQKFSTGIGQWIMNLLPNMKKWGEDLIQNLIDGILSKLPSFGGLINNIGNAISSKLHFSKPDEGPLADADQWMPDMIHLFASTMQRELPVLENASLQAAQRMAHAFNGVGGFGGAFTSVNGKAPYDQGQTFVDQFSNGAISRITTTSSPLGQMFSNLLTEVANQVIQNALIEFNRSVQSAAKVPGGVRIFGSTGSGLGGF